MVYPRRTHWPRVTVFLAAACLCVALAARPASAQPAAELRDKVSELMRGLGDLMVSVGSRTRGEVFSFMTTVELYNIDGEIDRLVGNPWQLSDSTQYKLALYPLNVAYPVYRQLLRQMTRLDDLRSQRIYNITPDAVDIIAVRLDILDDKRTGREFLDSVTSYFDAREVLDLGVFGLAHQPLFPPDQAGWDEIRHRLAARKGLVMASLLPLAAFYEAGALSRSGTLYRWPDTRFSLGWYGGFRRLGFRLHPFVRGGLSAQLPGVQLAAGLSEQIHPDAATANRALEVAVRESWINRLTAPTGWDSFFEMALRRVLASQDGFAGEWTTVRGGAFIKRARPLLISDLVVRGSAEVESDLDKSVRFAIGLGMDLTESGLSAVLQSSRTIVVKDGERVHDTRTGLFLAGTMEPPTRHYVDAMRFQARLLLEAWGAWSAAESRRQAAEAQVRVTASARLSASGSALQELGRLTAEAEERRVQLATLVPEYLEIRRMAYSLQRWPHSPGDLHGPLDGAVLRQSAEAVYGRLHELAGFLEQASAGLESIQIRAAEVRERREHGEVPVQLVGAQNEQENEQQQLARAWHEQSDQVSGAMRLYTVYRDSVRRINSAAGMPGLRQVDPLSLTTKRKLIALSAQTLDDQDPMPAEDDPGH